MKWIIMLIMSISLAIAQEINIESSDEEGSVEIKTPEGNIKIEIKGKEASESSKVKQEYEEKEETNDYIIIRKKEGRTIIKVLEPEGAQVEIYSETSKRPIHKAEIPTQYNYASPGFYKIIVYNDKGKWEKKIELKRGYETILYVKSLKSIEKPKEEVKRPMSPSSFRELMNSLKNEFSSSGKLNILKEAARGNYFTSEQVVDILSVFDVEKDKLDAAKMLYPRVIDKNNFFKVYAVFKFQADKEELREWVDNFESGKVSTDEKEGW